MKWEETFFEDLYVIPSKNGLTRPSSVRGNGYKMINMGELFDNDQIGPIDMERVQLNDVELQNMLVEPGDLLFARQSLVLAGAGKCSIVKEIDEPTTFESHIIRVRLNKAKAYPLYYYYYFKSPSCNIKSIVTQGVQAGIRGNDLKKLKIHVPSLEEQQKIASILSAYDNLIENNRRRIQLLEESARLLYREWFVDLRFPGHEHVKVKDGVPEGWERKTLGEVCFQYKKTVLPLDMPEGTPYIGIEHIPRRSITLDTWEFADKVASNKFVFEEKDILFGKIRPYFHKVGFAICKGITSSDTIVIRTFEHSLYHYVLMHVSSDYFIALASKTVKEGSKMPRADWGHLVKQTVIIPSESILVSFSEQIETVIQQLNTLALYNKKLTEARDLLLPRLMNGEIEV